MLLVAALLACATLPYLNILFNGFVHDDDVQVVAESLRPEFPVPQGDLYRQRLVFSWHPSVSNYYRPMMTLGYLLYVQDLRLAALRLPSG